MWRRSDLALQAFIAISPKGDQIVSNFLATHPP